MTQGSDLDAIEAALPLAPLRAIAFIVGASPAALYQHGTYLWHFSPECPLPVPLPTKPG
jgi:hypothetical protein